MKSAPPKGLSIEICNTRYFTRMATAADILAFDISGNQSFRELEAFIQDNETLSSEFVYMEASKQTPGNNLLYYEIHETDEAHDEIVLQALPPNLTQDQAAEFVDHLCDLGLQPFKSYFNVMVSGKLASILPCRKGQPPPTPNIADWVFTNRRSSDSTWTEARTKPITGSERRCSEAFRQPILPWWDVRCGFRSYERNSVL